MGAIDRGETAQSYPDDVAEALAIATGQHEQEVIAMERFLPVLRPESTGTIFEQHPSATSGGARCSGAVTHHAAMGVGTPVRPARARKGLAALAFPSSA
jgi:hypothetical protein